VKIKPQQSFATPAKSSKIAQKEYFCDITFWVKKAGAFFTRLWYNMGGKCGGAEE